MAHTLRLVAVVATLLLAALPSSDARAFCGFYVASADAKLFNKASQVILARDGERTTITMLNDYQGPATDFALVVPVPVVLKQDDVKVVDAGLFDRLDGFTKPRLVEYVDPNPCVPQSAARMSFETSVLMLRSADVERSRTLGVTVENSFTVGEYGIVILSATQSDGLETWLVENGYRMPRGAAAALKPYVGQGMKFFVAKVRLDAVPTGFSKLRPLQFAFDSPRFMLPMRLGMLNADGPQDLIVYTLTRKGRVEAANYRTERVATDVEVPVAMKEGARFGAFYGKLFEKAAAGSGFRTVFTEFAWDAGWCDPCAAPPPTSGDLVAAGARWHGGGALPNGTRVWQRQPVPQGATIVTRLHLRYTPASFPEDLVLQETGDRQPFQARYVMRHAAGVPAGACPQGDAYLRELPAIEARRENNVVSLTGVSTRELSSTAVAP